jgi:hypothetical protein
MIRPGFIRELGFVGIFRDRCVDSVTVPHDCFTVIGDPSGCGALMVVPSSAQERALSFFVIFDNNPSS